MTFAAALRSMLRQAPNIIMIGEIRDLETANIAINASLTGHLVFAPCTPTTRRAPSPVWSTSASSPSSSPPPSARSWPSVSFGDSAATARSRISPTTEMRALDSMPRSWARPHHGAGRLRKCRQTGYNGRMGIFEIFKIDDEVRHMINNNASTMELRNRARELGMRTLREDGIRKVLAGMTTAEEVI